MYHQSLVIFFAVAWVLGVFYELLFSLAPLLQPVELKLSSESYQRGSMVDLRVCVAEWVKADELSIMIISPEGVTLYSGRIERGSDNCMHIVFALKEAAEGDYTVVVARRNTILSMARFKVTD
ncbi:MAG: hypothetical protein QW630_05820 [Sulfolobales archaeon]